MAAGAVGEEERVTGLVHGTPPGFSEAMAVTYDALNDLVHDITDVIELATGLTGLDRIEVNDWLSAYLSCKSVPFEEDGW